MKKRILYVVLLIVLATLCFGVLSSCNNSSANFFDYSEDDLGVIGKLVSLMHGWIGNYGWTVVVFTVILKILMLPLDFWQRYSSRKSSLKMQRIQPLVEAIDKRYGANTQRANEEKQKLYKKQGYSMASMCLPMIISMVIFFTIFGGLRSYSTYSSITSFQNLSQTYHATFVEQIEQNETLKAQIEAKEGYEGAFAKYQEAVASGDAKNILTAQTTIISAAKQVDATLSGEYENVALEAVKEWYSNNHESWLWIQNVWQPDTWATVMQPYSGGAFGGGGFSSSGIDTSEYSGIEATYDLIRKAVLEGNGYSHKGSWNGLMILPFMSVGMSFLSQFISQRMERKNRNGETVQQNQQQAATNKTMMIIMPLMMAYFGFIYTGAFAIYMVFNYAISIVTTIALRVPVEKAVLKRLDRDDEKNKSSKASYMR